jgi:hypothetical protein
MNYEEYREKEKAIKADFSARRADLAKAEAKEICTAWGEHLSWKLKNCQFVAGDFVEYAARNWVVLHVKIEALRWSGHDVLAKLKRVKKDLSPTVRDEFEFRSWDPRHRLADIVEQFGSHVVLIAQGIATQESHVGKGSQFAGRDPRPPGMAVASIKRTVPPKEVHARPGTTPGMEVRLLSSSGPKKIGWSKYSSTSFGVI